MGRHAHAAADVGAEAERRTAQRHDGPFAAARPSAAPPVIPGIVRRAVHGVVCLDEHEELGDIRLGEDTRRVERAVTADPTPPPLTAAAPARESAAARMQRKCLSLSSSFVLSLSLLACGAPPSPGSPQGGGHSLYDRLGGKEGIHAVVDTFLKNLLADSRVSQFFRGDRGLPKFEQQLCELSGGPCRYTGKDMKSAHRGMGISGEQFEAFLQDFERALEEKGVTRSDEDEIVKALSPMRSDVVEKGKK